MNKEHHLNLNSRTSNSADFIRTDEFISHVNNDDILTYENEELSYCFEYNNVPLKRKSADTSTNAHGYQMLDFCKSNDLFILNGRFGEDKISPKLTCKDSSTVDYFISSAYNFAHIAALKVFDFSPLYSDAHCPITLHIGKCPQTIPPYKEINACITPKMKMKLWDKEKKDLFTQNLNRSFIADIDALLNVLLSAENVTVSDISSVMNDINDTFLNTCETTFGFSKSTPHKIDKPVRPWFNAECHQARNAYNKIRRLYNKNKTLHNKNMLKNLSKRYKSTLSKNARRFRNQRAERIRGLKNSNPKEYWRILNSGSKQKTKMAPLNDLFEYFKTINGAEINDTVPDLGGHNNPINEEINVPITADEITQAVKKLKNSKSPGTDDVLNEHIKSSLDLMLPVYLKLFNIIFDNGVVPDTWLIGNIIPIYKGKGDTNSAENYRPITLLSSLGKLFTAIINKQLSDYLESTNTIRDNQSGFRPGFTTTDNIFIINSMIDIFKSQKKKLYCTFVDFKQAFDRVWRNALWAKLNMFNINGKCLNVIKNIYENSKSRITTTEGPSAFFPCNIGVRQGDCLSPLLSTLFLNDLEHYLNQHTPGIDFDYIDDDITILLKLFILLYADDTVLFGESPEEHQNTLNAFQKYCEIWNLTINTEKTKVMIFSYGRISKNVHFI